MLENAECLKQLFFQVFPLHLLKCMITQVEPAAGALSWFMEESGLTDDDLNVEFLCVNHRFMILVAWVMD